MLAAWMKYDLRYPLLPYFFVLVGSIFRMVVHPRMAEFLEKICICVGCLNGLHT